MKHPPGRPRHVIAIGVSTILIILCGVILPSNELLFGVLVLSILIFIYGSWFIGRDLFQLFRLIRASNHKVKLSAIHDLLGLYFDIYNPSVVFNVYNEFRTEVDTYMQHKDDFEQKKIAAEASANEASDLFTQISVYNDICMSLLELSRGKKGKKRRRMIHTISEELNTRISALISSPRINNFREIKQLLASNIDTFKRRAEYIIEQQQLARHEKQKANALLPQPRKQSAHSPVRSKRKNKRRPRPVQTIDVDKWIIVFIQHPGAELVPVNINDTSFEDLIRDYSKNIDPSALRKQLGVLLHMDPERRRHFPRTKEVFAGFQKRPSGSLRIFFKIDEEKNEFIFGVKHRKELPPQYR